MRRKEARKLNRALFDKDCCLTCKRYSSAGMRVSGFCMKTRKSTKAKNLCGYYEPQYDEKYEQEFRMPSWNW